MGTEIERKYLISQDAIRNLNLNNYQSFELYQFYLDFNPENVVRVRLNLSKKIAEVTTKGKQKGISRKEETKEIDYSLGKSLEASIVGTPIHKTRYNLPHGNHLIELDVFHSNLAGLIVAEIELGSEEEAVDIPDWFGREVSTDPAYTNALLAQRGLPGELA